MNIIEKTIKALNRNPAAFIITIVGTIAQAIHTTKLAYDISPLLGYWITIESILIGIFFSIGLVFFTVRAGLIDILEGETPEVKADKMAEISDYYRTAKYFAIFEAFINLFYWIGAIIILPYFKNNNLGLMEILQSITVFDWFRLISGCVYAIALPIILRKYAGEIKPADLEETKEKRLNKRIDELSKKIESLQFEITIGDKKYDVKTK